MMAEDQEYSLNFAGEEDICNAELVDNLSFEPGRNLFQTDIHWMNGQCNLQPVFFTECTPDFRSGKKERFPPNKGKAMTIGVWEVGVGIWYAYQIHTHTSHMIHM